MMSLPNERQHKTYLLSHVLSQSHLTFWVAKHQQVYSNTRMKFALVIENFSWREALEANGTLSPMSWNGRIFIDEQSQVFFADSCNNRIRKIDQHGMISTIVDKTTFRVISKSIHILDQGRNIHSHHFQINTTILRLFVRARSFIWLNDNQL